MVVSDDDGRMVTIITTNPVLIAGAACEVVCSGRARWPRCSLTAAEGANVCSLRSIWCLLYRHSNITEAVFLLSNLYVWGGHYTCYN